MLVGEGLLGVWLVVVVGLGLVHVTHFDLICFFVSNLKFS